MHPLSYVAPVGAHGEVMTHAKLIVPLLLAAMPLACSHERRDTQAPEQMTPASRYETPPAAPSSNTGPGPMETPGYSNDGTTTGDGEHGSTAPDADRPNNYPPSTWDTTTPSDGTPSQKGGTGGTSSTGGSGGTSGSGTGGSNRGTMMP
jgi:hypothetical protein